MASIYNGTFVLGDVSATTLSAGNGIKITTDEPGVIKVSNDETVLYSGNAGVSSCVLSEPMTNFERIKIQFGVNAGENYYPEWFETSPNFSNFNLVRGKGAANLWWSWIRVVSTDSTHINVDATKSYNFGSVTATSWQNPGVTNNSDEDKKSIWKVVGINRKQNGGN